MQELGRGRAPRPDDAFTDALEQRLRAVHATLPAAGHEAGATTHPPAAAGRAWWRSPVPVAAGLVLLLTISFGAVLNRPAGVELAAAYDATVTLPDGRLVQARPGQRLAEGAVVLTGPNGHLLAGGVRLGPGEMAVVRDHRLQPVHEAQPERRHPAAPAEPPRRRPIAVVPSLPAMPRPGSPEPRPTRPQQPPSAQPEPGPTADPRRPPGDEPAPGEPGVHAGRQEPDAQHAMGLAATADEGRVFLSWTEFRDPRFAFFVILRASETAPTWPPSEGTELVGRSADPERRGFADGAPPRGAVYRVVAVDQDGRELARSGAVAPAPMEASGGRHASDGTEQTVAPTRG
ncbi:MAG TPA: hypothetical protein VNU01_09320 [Egibacteraceae bacterium]|nr:hypothetical protein [Egibacteraceae bacterium]